MGDEDRLEGEQTGKAEPAEGTGKEAEEEASQEEQFEEKLRRGELPEVPDWDLDAETKHLRKAIGKDPRQSGLGQSDRFLGGGGGGDDKHKTFGAAISAAYALIGFMGFGFFIGWVIDPHTPNGRAIGGLIGAILGTVSSVYLIYRLGGKS